MKNKPLEAILITFALAYLFTLLTSCVHKPPVATPKGTSNIRMACRPEAIIIQHNFEQAGIKSLIVSYQTARLGKVVRGHTIISYMFPQGKNQLNAWDSFSGSFKIPNTYYGDAWNTADKHLSRTSTVPGEYLKEAFIDDDLPRP